MCYVYLCMPQRARETYALHSPHTHTYTLQRDEKRMKRQPRMISMGKLIRRNRNIMVAYLNLSLFDFIWLTQFPQSEWKWSGFNKTFFIYVKTCIVPLFFASTKCTDNTQTKHTYTAYTHKDPQGDV